MKDMNSNTDMHRANAIRVLCRITDGPLLTQIERYLKQGIVDKNPVVASAALVSGIHLIQVISSGSLLFIDPFVMALILSYLDRWIPRLWDDGAMRCKKLSSQGLLLCNFMPWLFFTTYGKFPPCQEFWNFTVEMLPVDNIVVQIFIFYGNWNNNFNSVSCLNGTGNLTAKLSQFADKAEW